MTDKEKLERIKIEMERRLNDGLSMVPKNDYVRGRIHELNNLLAFIDPLQEEPECIYNHSLEERQRFCKYCSAACQVRIKEEPVSNPIDFEKELYKAFGQVKDFTLGLQIAKRFYDMGKNHQEPISEELEAELTSYIENNFTSVEEPDEFLTTVMQKDNMLALAKHFADWQKKQCIETAEDIFTLVREDVEKEVIAKACNWLEEHLLDYWGQLNANDTDEFIEKFKKEMEG